MSGGEKTRQAIAAQPDWLARVPTDRRLPPGPRALHGLRDVVPRGADGRRGRAGARARPPARARGRPARLRQPRGHDADDARGGAGLGRADVARDRRSPRARWRSSRTRSSSARRRSRRAGATRRATRPRSPRSRPCAARTCPGCPGAVADVLGGPAASRSPSTNAGSSSAPAATGRRRRRPCSSCGRERTSRRRRGRPSSFSTGTWPRWTRACARSCSKARARAAERARETPSRRSASSART